MFWAQRAIHFSTYTNPFSSSKVKTIFTITQIIIEFMTMDDFKNIEEIDIHDEAGDEHKEPK